MIKALEAKRKLQETLGCIVSMDNTKEGYKLIVRGVKTELTEFMGFPVICKAVALPKVKPIKESKHHYFDSIWEQAKSTMLYFSLDDEFMSETEARVYISQKGFKSEYVDFAILIKTATGQRFMCRSDLLDATRQ